MRRFEGFEFVNSTDMSGPTLEAKLPQTVARMCLMHKWDNSKDMYICVYIYIYIYANAFPGYSSAKRLLLRDACGGQLFGFPSTILAIQLFIFMNHDS